MPDHYLETKGELTDIRPVKKRRIRPLTLAIDIILIIFIVAAVSVSANVIYLRVAFGVSFFVNGMSMYPTLNATGTRTVNGVTRTLTWHDSNNRDGDFVDYGWATSKEGWRNNLKRFDIVITNYPIDFRYENGDYVRDSEGKLVFLNESSKNELKIKRLIGFPGERVKIENDGSAWGKTTIFTPDNPEGTVLKNLYDWKDYPADQNGKEYTAYPLITGTWPSETEYFGENEYFVCGDNRRNGFSSDSRGFMTDRPLLGDMMVGQACLVTAQRRLKANGFSGLEPEFVLTSLKMPWDYIDLRNH